MLPKNEPYLIVLVTTMKGWTLLNLFRHIEFLWILIVFFLKTNKNIKLLYQQLTLIFCVTTQYLRDLSSWTHRQQTSDIMDIWIGIVQVLPIIVNKLKSLKVAKWRKDEWRMMKDEWRMIKYEWRMIKYEWRMMKDERWRMKDDDFKLLKGFALWQTDGHLRL